MKNKIANNKELECIAPNGLIAKINSHLENELGIQKKETLGDTGYIVDANFIVKDHFDLKAEWLILDTELASIGLIRILDTKPGNDIGNYVDQAAYFLHLLHQAKVSAKNEANRIVPAIELVVLLPHEEKSKASTALRNTITESKLLNGIKVNLLPFKNNAPFFEEEDLRRAFGWLLTKTRNWYRQWLSKSKSNYRLNSLTLTDFRLQGTRTLNLSKDIRVHVVHGNNGTGKSAIAEALELITTGQLRRLRDFPDEYNKVLINKTAKNATISIERGDKLKDEYQILKNGINNPLNAQLDGSSLIFDLASMFGLSTPDSVDFAAAFLSAFFPDEIQILKHFNEAEKNAHDAFNSLPIEFKAGLAEYPEEASGKKKKASTERFKTIAEQFDWIENPEISERQFCDFLPLKMETLIDLLPLLGTRSSEIKHLIETPSSKDTIEEKLNIIDSALEPLQINAEKLINQLKICLKALERLASWKPEVDSGQASWAENLTKWLESVALHDLTEKKLLHALTISEAKKNAWTPPIEYGSHLIFPDHFSEAELLTIKNQEQSLKELRDNLFSQVTASHPQEGTPRISSKSATISPDEVLALNEIGAIIFPGVFIQQGLGSAWAQAINERRPIAWGDMPIGDGEFFITIIDLLKPAMHALQKVAEINSRKLWHSGVERFEAIQRVQSTHKKLEFTSKLLKGNFLEKLRSDNNNDLTYPFSELTELFTPASWSYEPLHIKFNASGTSIDAPETLEITGSDNLSSALRLNTAEQNSLALALFLLLAIRINNPLKILVLDDPFQNMDEMTVAAVCRGIHRIIRLWPDDDWQLLVLLHRESDATCFREEIPCAFYQLPWLGLKGSDDSASNEPIRKLSERLDKEMIDLNQIMHKPDLTT